jgi:hypothetical protein
MFLRKKSYVQQAWKGLSRDEDIFIALLSLSLLLLLSIFIITITSIIINWYFHLAISILLHKTMCTVLIFMATVNGLAEHTLYMKLP